MRHRKHAYRARRHARRMLRMEERLLAMESCEHPVAIEMYNNTLRRYACQSDAKLEFLTNQ